MYGNGTNTDTKFFYTNSVFRTVLIEPPYIEHTTSAEFCLILNGANS